MCSLRQTLNVGNDDSGSISQEDDPFSPLGALTLWPVHSAIGRSAPRPLYKLGRRRSLMDPSDLLLSSAYPIEMRCLSPGTRLIRTHA